MPNEEHNILLASLLSAAGLFSAGNSKFLYFDMVVRTFFKLTSNQNYLNVSHPFCVYNELQMNAFQSEHEFNI
jgi:hypothetical protein